MSNFYYQQGIERNKRHNSSKKANRFWRSVEGINLAREIHGVRWMDFVKKIVTIRDEEPIDPNYEPGDEGFGGEPLSIDFARSANGYTPTEKQIAALRKIAADWKVKKATKDAQREKVETENRATSKSRHISEIGQRINLEATYVASEEKKNRYGDFFSIEKFLVGDDEMTCFGQVPESFEVGSTATIRVTVKAHKEFDGVQQTVVNRIAMV
jgi:hypothetical protein